MGFHRAITLAVAISLAAGLCACTPSLQALHDPLYRERPHTSTITAKAVAYGGDRIRRIKITVIEGEMTACNQWLPSLLPCRRGATTRSKTCRFKSRSATCAFPLDLGDRRLVTYKAEAISRYGSRTRTAPITYAAGASITRHWLSGASWDVARPIWWHTAAPSGSEAAGQIDMGFFPDDDWPKYGAFTDALQPLIRAAHFDRETPFSQTYSYADHRFNLWAGPEGAHATGFEDGCDRFFRGFAANAAGVTDAEAVVHLTKFRDCASISFEGSGSVEAGNDAAMTYVHETGHFVMGFGDEYCCDGGYSSISRPPNVFAAEFVCKATADAEGLPRSLCVRIGNRQAWRMNDGQDSTMGYVRPSSDWRAATRKGVTNRLAGCAHDDC